MYASTKVDAQRQAKGLEKERDRRRKGAGEGKGLEKERGWRRKGAGEGKWLEKERVYHISSRQIS
jgi:hypothetical protein